MKKFYILMAAAVILFSTEAKAFIISPHVGLDYVSATPNGFGDIDSLNGGAISVGVKALGFLSVEGFYQQYASTDAFGSSKTKPEVYGIDLVVDTLNLGVVELLTTVGYGKYTLDGGALDNKMKNFEGNAYRTGIGAQFNLSDNIGIRAMYRYVFPEDNTFKRNVQELTVGIRYYFF